MKKLEDYNWKAFRIGDLFEIEPCKCSKVCEFHQGEIPYVGATNNNNGVLKFIENKESFLTEGNCIAFICDGDGSIGLSVYKKESFIGSTTVKVGRSRYLNKYVGTFIVAVADLGRKRYSFGYKRNEEHLSNERLMLPVNSKDEPDYAFMEEYMREVEKRQKEKYKAHIQRKIEELGDIENLEDKEWKAFALKNIFDEIQRGKRLKTDDHVVGSMPYVSSSSIDNGVDDFIGNEDDVRIFEDCITLANSGSVGSAFYQPFKFVASDHVTKLKQASFSKHVYLFIANQVSKLGEKYSFNREINDKRLGREYIMLPINSDGEPDYVFMENYMKRKEMEMLKRYVERIDYKRLNNKMLENKV